MRPGGVRGMLDSGPMATAAPSHSIPRLRSRDVVLVVNPHASRVRPAVVAGVQAELVRFGASVQTLVTESADEAIGTFVDAEGRRLVLVGGDGTLHAAANTPGVRPELALIPAGRANNVVRSLGIPLDPRAAARLAVEGKVRPIDAVEVVTPSVRLVAVEGVSIGFLSQARSLYHERNSSHLDSALAAGVAALARFHPLRVRVTRRGSAEELTLAQLFVANLPLYAFGLQVAPDADPTDRLLDVLAIEGHGRHDVLPMILRLLRATELERAEAHHWRAEHVRVDTHGALPVVADSRDLGPGPVDLGVLPRELPLVRP